jgi:hypothetical protein
MHVIDASGKKEMTRVEPTTRGLRVVAQSQVDFSPCAIGVPEWVEKNRHCGLMIKKQISEFIPIYY